MKKYIIISFILVLFCSACEPNLKPQKPDNLIPQATMTDLLYDMFIASSAKGVNRTKFEKLGLDPETYILKKYNIDSLQFAKSNDYYAHDIELYKSMIEAIKTKLTTEKDKYTAIDEKEVEENKRKKDSLKAIKDQLKRNLPLKKNIDLKIR